MLTEAQMAEIRERGARGHRSWLNAMHCIEQDIPALLAEIGELREKLRQYETCGAQPCVVCRKPAWVCEYVDNRLPCGTDAHHGSSELTTGDWVCSPECWEKAAESGEEADRG